MFLVNQSGKFINRIRDAARILVCASALCLSNSSVIGKDSFIYAGEHRMELLKEREKNINSATEKLAKDSLDDRYSALMNLRSFDTLPDLTIDRAIGFLDDFSGIAPGNTVAAEAAELLSEHPDQANRAIPHLLKLLGNETKYHRPADSAAIALTAIKRQDIEKYIGGLSANDRKQLGESLMPNLRDGNYSSSTEISEIMGMLPNTNSLSSLENILEMAKSNQNSPSARVLAVRAEAAINIIRAGAKIGDAKYLEEMKRADKMLGRPSSYATPDEKFSVALEELANRMKQAQVEKAYIISQEEFPFRSYDGGIPVAREINSKGFRYLYNGYDQKGRSLPNKPLVVLTEASKKGFKENNFPSFTPDYLPFVSDFDFIELGVNGRSSFDKALRSMSVGEGLRQDIWYEYWPSDQLIYAEKYLPKSPGNSENLVWIVVSKGKIVNGARTSKKD